MGLVRAAPPGVRRESAMSETHTRRVGRVAALVAVVVALVAAGVAGPAAASGAAPPDDRRAGVFHLWFAGTVAQAVWSTCGEDLQPGQVCTTTEVMAFLSSDREQAGSEYQLHSRRSPVVRLFQGTCEVQLLETELLCVPLGERFGRSTTGTVDASPHLDVVTADAEVPVQVWRPGEEDSTGTVDVMVVWTGTGDAVRLDERDHQVSGGSMALSGTKGWQRACTAAAEIDGMAPPGDLVSCDLFRVRQVDLRVYRGGPV